MIREDLYGTQARGVYEMGPHSERHDRGSEGGKTRSRSAPLRSAKGLGRIGKAACTDEEMRQGVILSRAETELIKGARRITSCICHSGSDPALSNFPVSPPPSTTGDSGMRREVRVFRKF